MILPRIVAIGGAIVVGCSSPSFAEWVSIGDVKLPERVNELNTPLWQPFGGLKTLSDVPTEKLKAVLGVGFDYISGELLPEACVDPVSGRADIDSGSSVQLANKHEYISSVMDMASHQSASGESVGFDFTYKLVSLGGDTSTTSDSYFNSVDAFARIYSRFTTHSIERIGGTWSASARLAVGDKKRFLEVCGTHYVSGIYSGNVLDETIRFTLKSNSQTSADKQSLTLGIGDLFGANYSSTDREADVRKVSTIQLVDQSRGIISTGLPNPQDEGGVQASVIYGHVNYPSIVAAAKVSDGVPLYLDVEPYYRLNAAHSGNVPRLSESLMAKVTSKLSLYEILLSAISDIKFGMSYTDDAKYAVFYKTPKADLPKLLDDAQALRLKFAQAVEKCGDLIKSFGSQDSNGYCSTGLDVLTASEIDKVSIKKS